MNSWFGGIGQAASGLRAAQYGLDVVSQNITNEATPGYTRQVSNQVAVDGSSQTGLYTRAGAMFGVQVISTTRTADAVLDARVRSEHARGGVADASATALTAVEGTFPEPTDQGLSAQLGAIWTSFGNVANNPGPSGSGTRTVLLDNVQTVVGTLNTMSASLSDLATSTSAYLSNDVATANSAATQLATLNGQISVTAATGGNTNALLDTRDQLLDKLSKSVGATATINANGTADVTVGGVNIVSNVSPTAMSVDLDPASATAYQVSVGGAGVPITGGTASGEITALTTTIPGYSGQLDLVANTLRDTINSVQAAGFDQSGAAGRDLLGGSGAAGIALATTDGTKIAASSTSSTSGNLDGGNALIAADIGAQSGSPDALYASLVGDVAAKSAFAQQQQSTQASVVSSVENLQASVSGVDENEEVTNMLTYQHAFSAASRVLTTMDSMLDTLINHTGLVGQA